MPASLASLTAVLKERYQGKIRKQLRQEAVALRRIESSSEGVTNEVGGKYVTFPIHTRRNAGIGARNEGEALPLPGQQGAAAARIGLKYEYGSIELTGQAMKLATKDPQSFVKSVDFEMDGLKDDLLKDTNRQVYGNGTGELARTTAASAALVLTVNSVQYFDLDMQIDVITLPGTVTASNRKVLSVDEAASTITVDGANITAGVNAVIVRHGSFNREITGFTGLFSDTTPLFNIDPATEPVWKSYVSSNGGTPRAISESLIMAVINETRRRGGKITAMFTTPGVYLSYFNLLSQQRQFVNTKEFAGGFSGLAFVTDGGEIPIVVDFDCPPGTLYGVNEKDLKIYQEADWSFMDEDGSMWQRKVTSAGNFDAYWATMYKYMEIGLGRRNSHFVIRDLEETTV